MEIAMPTAVESATPAANCQRNRILEEERRGKKDQSRYGQTSATNQVILRWCYSRTRPIP